jgi:hypothetical protein
MPLGALVLRQHNTQRLLQGPKAAPQFSPRRRLLLAVAHGLGGLHGRNLASALMRSRLPNRTWDRGRKPIRLTTVGRGHGSRSGA